jgi:mannose-6-phosphate isomerase class I
VIGPGAVLSNWKAPVIYIDLPKNELQFRMRAGSIFNLGSKEVQEPFHMYKRFNFVDWVLLNAHKKAIQDNISIVADCQWVDDITWMHGSSLAEGLQKLSNSVLRVKPWFEPGAWGGQWIKDHIPQLNKDVINYAWSFELIVPENGLLFESDGVLLEVSFDFLMFRKNKAVLGRHAGIFGDEFPIRFDFLDTFKGGNLSIQCHPSRNYIQEQFGENITQDETYYILDCDEQAQVYLGFQEHIEPDAFKAALETSQKEGVELNIEDYVQVHKAKKHDLFLIPNQTVHSAGAGSLVLEISATPYIFTFKMYDWLRLDLDKKPRPINIEHAFNNLDFSRKGSKVQEELISKPAVLTKGPDWQVVHLPTHQDHFYDIHRIEFQTTFSVETGNTCHVLMVVEGQSVLIETADGTKQEFAYAETFVVPAAAQSYRLTNTGEDFIKVIKAFLK